MSSAEEQTTSAEPAASGGATNPKLAELREQVLTALKVVHDPEIPVNIVDLGLVYDVDVRENGHVDITMTLTTMGCPVQDMIQSDAELAVMRVDGVSRANVEIIWSPPWGMDKVTDDGRKQLRMFGFSV